MTDELSNVGHNTEAGRKLNAYVQRIEGLMAEKKDLQADITAEFQAAKAEGYDPKIMRAVIKLRAEDKARRQEREAMIETYLHALGEI